MNDETLQRLKTEQAELLERGNKLGNFRMSAEHAALTAHSRDLIAAQATSMAALDQILRLRIKLEEYERATAQPE